MILNWIKILLLCYQPQTKPGGQSYLAHWQFFQTYPLAHPPRGGLQPGCLGWQKPPTRSWLGGQVWIGGTLEPGFGFGLGLGRITRWHLQSLHS